MLGLVNKILAEYLNQYHNESLVAIHDDIWTTSNLGTTSNWSHKCTPVRHENKNKKHYHEKNKSYNIVSWEKEPQNDQTLSWEKKNMYGIP